MSIVVPRPRPGILEISPYVGGKAEAGGGVPVIKLSSNESAIGPSPKAKAAYADLAATLHRYPDGGATALRRALGRRFNLDPERLVCGAGSDELLALLVRGYAGPGDEVLMSEHGFLMYKISALAAGANVVMAPEKDLRADVDALLARVTSRTRIVFVANPNNPTGSYLSGEELARLHAGLPADVLLVIDAAYAEFVSAADYTSGQELAQAHANVVMTRTFSKLFGLAALRVGWMLAGAEVTDVVNRIRGPFNLSQAGQAAAVAALEDQDHQTAAKAHNDRWLPWLATADRGAGASWSIRASATSCSSTSRTSPAGTPRPPPPSSRAAASSRGRWEPTGCRGVSGSPSASRTRTASSWRRSGISSREGPAHEAVRACSPHRRRPHQRLAREGAAARGPRRRDRGDGTPAGDDAPRAGAGLVRPDRGRPGTGRRGCRSRRPGRAAGRDGRGRGRHVERPRPLGHRHGRRLGQGADRPRRRAASAGATSVRARPSGSRHRAFRARCRLRHALRAAALHPHTHRGHRPGRRPAHQEDVGDRGIRGRPDDARASRPRARRSPRTCRT